MSSPPQSHSEQPVGETRMILGVPNASHSTNEARVIYNVQINCDSFRWSHCNRLGETRSGKLPSYKVAGGELDRLVHRFVELTQYTQPGVATIIVRCIAFFWDILETCKVPPMSARKRVPAQMEASLRRNFVHRKTGLESATRRDNAAATTPTSSACSILPHSPNVN